MKRVLALLLAYLACLSLPAAEYKAGVARTKITPPTPFWLSGYAARTHPADSVLRDLWAKALALEDAGGQRVVIVTMDLIGIPREVSDAVGEQARQRYRLRRSQVLLNASHTHCGPAVGKNLNVMFDFSPAEAERVDQYRKRLTADLVAVIGAALDNLAPAQLSTGHGEVSFAINRRQPTPSGVRLGVNLPGPVDHDVPVLKITTPEGRVRAVLFGYACHNTTLGGDFYQINGDYAGFAQAEIERAFPEATAMFVMLCGGDQNPYPRGTVPLAEQHGLWLATEVRRVVATELAPVQPPMRTAYESIRLDFAPHTRQGFEGEAKNPDKFRQRRAKLMLAAYDQKQPIRQVSYPVQVVRLGPSLTFLALGGEVVVDYSLRAKREFPLENLVVAGYCNEVMCYIPSRRVLKEGGYEPVDSMIYYGQPGPFTESVEEKIFKTIRKVMKKAGVKSKPISPP